jgi:hypothetical protein
MKSCMLAAVSVLLVSGCSSLPPDEFIWQTAHAFDVAQTVQIAKNPECYRETDPVTSRLIGEHPSQGGVYAWGIGTAALHAGVSALLEKYDAKPWVKGVWKAVSFTTVIYTVNNNFNEGLGVNSARDCR